MRYRFQSQNGLILVQDNSLLDTTTTIISIPKWSDFSQYNENEEWCHVFEFQSQNGLILVDGTLMDPSLTLSFQSQNGLILVSLSMWDVVKGVMNFNPKMV